MSDVSKALSIPLAGTRVHLTYASPADTDVILALARQFHEEDGHPLTTVGEDAVRRLLTDSRTGLIFKIEDEERPIGYMALCFGFSIEWGGRDAVLDDFYLLSSARGRGLGRLAIEALARMAREEGCFAFHLEVIDGNRAAMLYERAGFVDRGSKLLTRVL